MNLDGSGDRYNSSKTRKVMEHIVDDLNKSPLNGGVKLTKPNEDAWGGDWDAEQNKHDNTKWQPSSSSTRSNSDTETGANDQSDEKFRAFPDRNRPVESNWGTRFAEDLKSGKWKKIKDTEAKMVAMAEARSKMIEDMAKPGVIAGESKIKVPKMGLIVFMQDPMPPPKGQLPPLPGASKEPPLWPEGNDWMKSFVNQKVEQDVGEGPSRTVQFDQEDFGHDQSHWKQKSQTSNTRAARAHTPTEKKKMTMPGDWTDWGAEGQPGKYSQFDSVLGMAESESPETHLRGPQKPLKHVYNATTSGTNRPSHIVGKLRPQIYAHTQAIPNYFDTKEEPYARFIFTYRNQGME